MTVIDRIATAGGAAWPGIRLSPGVLLALCADAEPDPAHDAELYLACALAAADSTALRIFDREFVPELAATLARLRLPGGAIDEVLQVLRIELFTGERPRITEYSGCGALRGWLSVTATRRALRMFGGKRRELMFDEPLLEQLGEDQRHPVHAHVRARCTAELKQAMADAFAALELRQRNLLRQHIVDELSIDELATMYRVHRATCARWIADAREELGRSARKRLGETLALRPTELASMLRFLDSDIELSVPRLLGAA